VTETREMFATCGTADQIDAGIGVIWWATHSPGNFALSVVDYDVFEVPTINAAWLADFFARSVELVAKYQPNERGCLLRVEQKGLLNILKLADEAYVDATGSRGVDRSIYDIRKIRDHEAAKWPVTLDERAFLIRPLVNSGKVVKLETGLRRFSFRAIRTNHLVSQIKRHRPGDAASAGELLHAFVLGVLLGTTRRSMSCFERFGPAPEKGAPSKGPFGGYISGKRPL
jgi:hypothetical protein